MIGGRREGFCADIDAAKKCVRGLAAISC